MTAACNICGSTSFSDLGKREKIFCDSCGSYERTRIMKFEIDRMGVGPHTRVLHLAPERGLYQHLSKTVGDYVCGDIDLERYSHIPSIRRVDLCEAETFEGLGKFDLIIHSHVIEHVPCNYTVVLTRLHRMLKPGGAHVFSLPIYGAAYEEDLSAITEEEKTRRFGQYDHCRRFSPKDLRSTLGALFRIDAEYDLSGKFPPEALRAANIPEETWRGYTGHTVFVLRPEDILI